MAPVAETTLQSDPMFLPQAAGRSGSARAPQEGPGRRPHRPWRWIGRIVGVVAGLVVLAVLGLAATIGYLAAREPGRGGSATLPGLGQDVAIVYDKLAIPRVTAASWPDAWRTLGWLHARDRLWQMEQQRLFAAGRLAEVIGAPGLASDRLMRTLGFAHRLEAEFQALQPETQAIMTAYAEGVNAYLQARRHPLPLEFQLLLHEPEAWRPQDALLVSKLFTLSLSGGYRGELALMRAAGVLTPEQLQDITPGMAGGPISLARLGPEKTRLAEAAGRLEAALPRPWTRLQASNTFALAPSRTKEGGALLGSDPHLGLDRPGVWFMARIDVGAQRLQGVTLPGVPFFLMGQNERLAWGVTTTTSDLQDLVLEAADPADPGRYRTETGSEPFATRTETLKVRLRDDETLTVRATRHGPVLSDLDPAATAALPAGQMLALAWAPLQQPDTTADAMATLNRAQSVAAAIEASRRWVSPQQNLSLADAEGHIALTAPALMPIRTRGDGRLPVNGWEGPAWSGFVPFEDWPRVIDPASGALWNANNPIVGPDHPSRLRFAGTDTYRGRRLEALLSDPGVIVSPDQAAGLMLDITAEDARELMPLLLAVPAATPRAAKVRDLLAGWDFQMAADQPQPLIYTAWLARLRPLMVDDELKGLSAGALGLDIARLIYLLRERPVWCDRVDTTDRVESCAAILAAARDEALDRLAATYGPDPAAWRWGAAHRAPFRHPLLRLVAGARLDLDLAVPGGETTLRRAGGTPTADMRFPVTHGAGYRALYDPRHPDQSRFVIALGNPGSVFDAAASSFAPLWAAGSFVTLGPLDAAAILARETLTPNAAPSRAGGAPTP